MSALPVAVDAEGAAAPPRVNGELAFAAPWEGRAFGLCVAVLEREGATWADFRPHLVQRVAEDPDRPYYESLVAALEDFVAARSLVT